MAVLHIAGNWGLGDNIFQRPFIRVAAQFDDVFLDTPWPELYADLPIKFIRNRHREGMLRTQTKNMQRQGPGVYVPAPRVAKVIRTNYGHATFDAGVSIVRHFERLFPLRGHPLTFDLPDMGPAPIRSSRPIAVIRPVTVRKEWRNEARNPRPEYIAHIARRLLHSHHVISVADLKPGAEWLVGEAPPAHQYLHAGELNVRQLLALIGAADCVVGGVGWIVPASCALQTDCFVILGGHGKHNAPAVITDPRMGLERLGFATPDRFCMCSNMRHSACDKTISNLDEQFDRWLDQIERANHARACAAQ